MKKRTNLILAPLLLTAGSLFLAQPTEAKAQDIKPYVGVGVSTFLPMNSDFNQVFSNLLGARAELGLKTPSGRLNVNLEGEYSVTGRPLTQNNTIYSSTTISGVSVGVEGLAYLTKSNPKIYLGGGLGYTTFTENISQNPGIVPAYRTKASAPKIKGVLGLEGTLADSLSGFIQVEESYAPSSQDTGIFAGNKPNLGGTTIRAGLRIDL